MGHLKNITNQSKIQTFPSSTFEIAGDVPASQCSEAQIEGDNAQTDGPPWAVLDPGKFAGWNLAGKTLHITAANPGPTGDFAIVDNDDNRCRTLANLNHSINVVYYISNGGELILTRDVQSFAEFIRAAGYAYTIKGGKLYTNMPSNLLQNACTILFDPLT